MFLFILFDETVLIKHEQNGATCQLKTQKGNCMTTGNPRTSILSPVDPLPLSFVHGVIVTWPVTVLVRAFMRVNACHVPDYYTISKKIIIKAA